MDANQIEFLLGEYLSGKADQSARNRIEAWLLEHKNIPTFHSLLLRYETDHPVFQADTDHALALCKARLT
jgi:hypothetical protein